MIFEHLLEHHKFLPKVRRDDFVGWIIMLYGTTSQIKHAMNTFYALVTCKRSVMSLDASLKV